MRKGRIAGWMLAGAVLASSCFPVGALTSQTLTLPSGWNVDHVELGTVSQGLIPYYTQSGAGYLDTTGKVVIQAIYAEVFPFTGDYAQVRTKTGKSLWVDKQGNEYEQLPENVDQSMWWQALTQDNGLYLTNQGDDPFMFGYQDEQGNVVIPCKYQKAGAFYQGVAPVTEDGVHWYAIDTKGNKVRDINYSGLEDAIGGGLLTYRIGDLTGLVNDQGRVIIPVGQYQEYVYLGQGIFKAREREFDNASPCHLYRVDGTRVTSVDYADFGVYSEGLASVYDAQGNLGFIDTEGRVQVPLEYQSPMLEGDDQGDVIFHDGYACVRDESGFVLLKNPLTEEAEQEQSEQEEQSKPEQSGITAVRTNAKVRVDKKDMAFDIYNINGNNYFKLRDVAYVLNGTGSQFSVSFDVQSDSITLMRGEAYTVAGNEMQPGTGTDAVQAVTSSQKVVVNGRLAGMEAYNIGGSNYFKLRDLADRLNFSVSWNQAAQTVDITSVKAQEKPTEPQEPVEETPQQAVLRLVNEERQKAGLSALTTSDLLQQAADIRAKEMNQLISHDRPDGSSCFTVLDELHIDYSVAGENIASGVDTAEAVMQAWMQSEGHKANILSEDFTQIGIGNDGVHWVQIFIS